MGDKMKTLDEQLNILIDAQIRTAQALERMAACQEAQLNYMKKFRETVCDEAPAPDVVMQEPVKAKAVKKVKPEVTPVVEEAKPVHTVEEVGIVLRKIIAKQGGKHTKAAEIMAKYGASSQKPLIRDIKPEKYADLILEAETFLKEGV